MHHDGTVRAGSRTIVFCLVVALLVPASSAGTVIPKTLDELTEAADYVVVGTVLSQESRLDDRTGMILTDTTIHVDEPIVGAPGSTLVVTEYGGIVGGKGLAVPGLPTFRVDERVVVFACFDALGLLRTCGAQQGRLAVLLDEHAQSTAFGDMAGQPIREPLDVLKARIVAAREVRR